MTSTTYPVHVEARLDPRVSRWLWLIKWLLVIPHYLVLVFLWIGFVFSAVASFVAILITGRYPRPLFDFNVGVLRWSWRVSYYAYGALGTDRYPPFSLADEPDYPAHFDVDYPERLSRGLVLVKWWLLAIPHYLIVGVFLGGGTWALTRDAGGAGGSPGLVGLLVLIAGVILLFTGRYPSQIFGFVLGMDRWALRVAAYAALMTDRYPPFRLDMGGEEGAGITVRSGPPNDPPTGPAATTPSSPGSTMTTPPPPSTPPPPTVQGPAPAPRTGRGWTPWRVVSVVLGVILGVGALGLLGGGGAAAWAIGARDSAGFLTTDRQEVSTAGYAITTERIDLTGLRGVASPSRLLGTVRVRAAAVDPEAAVFVGVGPSAAVDAYLAGVDHTVVTDAVAGNFRTTEVGGVRPPSAPPAAAGVWAVQTAGTGTQTLTFRPQTGVWTVVVMNPGAGPGVSTRADVGATLPELGPIAATLLVAGGALLVVAVVLVVFPAVRAARRA